MRANDAKHQAKVLSQLDAGQQLVETRADRIHRERSNDFAFGASKVTACHDLGASLLQPFEGGQGSFDAQIIGDRSVAQGHIEVNAHQHTLAVEVTKIFETGHARSVTHAVAAAPSSPTKSTMRFE